MFQSGVYLKFRDMEAPRPTIPRCRQANYLTVIWILMREHIALLLVKIILRSSFVMEIQHALSLRANTLSE